MEPTNYAELNQIYGRTKYLELKNIYELNKTKISKIEDYSKQLIRLCKYSDTCIIELDSLFKEDNKVSSEICKTIAKYMQRLVWFCEEIEMCCDSINSWSDDITSMGSSYRVWNHLSDYSDSESDENDASSLQNLAKMFKPITDCSKKSKKNQPNN